MNTEHQLKSKLTWPKCPKSIKFKEQACVNWRHLQMLFSFFKIFIFWALRGVRSKKWPKMTILSVSLHISGTIHHDCGFWYTYIKWWCLLNIFSKFLFFTFYVGGGKRTEKWPVITSFSLSHSILSKCLVHSCKIVISPGVFLYFF